MKCIVLDLDNTIADDEWRIPAIKWDEKNMFLRYHNYHTLSAHDKVGNRHLFKNKKHIIVLTARPEFYRSQTKAWLMANDIVPVFLGMRGKDDECHSRELKVKQMRDAMRFLSIKESDIACAYDDREDVVQAYLEMGIKVQVVSIHDTCSYTKPKENHESN